MIERPWFHGANLSQVLSWSQHLGHTSDRTLAPAGPSAQVWDGWDMQWTSRNRGWSRARVVALGGGTAGVANDQIGKCNLMTN